MEAKLFILSCVLAVATADFVLDEKAQKIIGDCATETDVDLDKIFESAKNEQLPTTESGKCFVECVMEKSGMLEGGKVNVEKVREISEKHFGDTPELKEKADKVADICVAEVTNPGGKCEFATALAACAMKRGKEMGIPHPNFVM
uniref:Odorant-binding protein 17 n=1 Tax=Yemma signatus TaxID=300820 RepID=A0A3G2GRS4_9HEMI|nr:odorant-binding protein 17 [Yemma signatus]